MADLFLLTLKEQQKESNNQIAMRVDYYFGHNIYRCLKLNDDSTVHKYASLDNDSENLVRASEVRFSLYTSEYIHPTFKEDDLKWLIEKYDEHLNKDGYWFFKKNPYKNIFVERLLNAKNDRERYLLALASVRDQKDDEFLKFVKIAISRMQVQEKDTWEGFNFQ